eukprot:747760-Hanusia_phi.AAC.1
MGGEASKFLDWIEGLGPNEHANQNRRSRAETERQSQSHQRASSYISFVTNREKSSRSASKTNSSRKNSPPLLVPRIIPSRKLQIESKDESYLRPSPTFEHSPAASKIPFDPSSPQMNMTPTGQADKAGSSKPNKERQSLLKSRVHQVVEADMCFQGTETTFPVEVERLSASEKEIFSSPIADSKYNTALLLKSIGHYDRAKSLFDECRQIYTDIYGPGHKDALDAAAQASTCFIVQATEEEMQNSISSETNGASLTIQNNEKEGRRRSIVSTEEDMQRSLTARTLFVAQENANKEGNKVSGFLPSSFVIEGLEMDQEAELSSEQTPQIERGHIEEFASHEKRVAEGRAAQKRMPDAQVASPKMEAGASDLQRLHGDYISVVRNVQSTLSLLSSSQEGTRRAEHLPA